MHTKTNTAEVTKTFTAVATSDNAAYWAATDEKFIFCITLLEMSAHEDDADYWVDKMESRFEEILAA